MKSCDKRPVCSEVYEALLVRRHPEAMAVSVADLERFCRKVQIESSGCWGWLGYVAKNGYVRFFCHGSLLLGHRLSYEIANGRIPDGLEIDHLCRNRSCVNPSHLEPVTRRENVHRGINVTRTHCRRGHPIESWNSRPSLNGGRGCLICSVERNKSSEYKHKRRQWERIRRMDRDWKENRKKTRAKYNAKKGLLNVQTVSLDHS